jgi:hypothetical protein
MKMACEGCVGRVSGEGTHSAYSGTHCVEVNIYGNVTHYIDAGEYVPEIPESHIQKTDRSYVNSDFLGKKRKRK